MNPSPEGGTARATLAHAPALARELTSCTRSSATRRQIAPVFRETAARALTGHHAADHLSRRRVRERVARDAAAGDEEVLDLPRDGALGRKLGSPEGLEQPQPTPIPHTVLELPRGAPRRGRRTKDSVRWRCFSSGYPNRSCMGPAPWLVILFACGCSFDLTRSDLARSDGRGIAEARPGDASGAEQRLDAPFLRDHVSSEGLPGDDLRLADTGKPDLCMPSCAGKCAGAEDGCNGTCQGNTCKGCCQGSICQPGNQSAACGTAGIACTSCGSGTVCSAGTCQSQPQCPCKGMGDGCGGQCATGKVFPTNNTSCDPSQNGLCVCNGGFSSCGQDPASWGCNCNLSTHVCGAGLGECNNK